MEMTSYRHRALPLAGALPYLALAGTMCSFCLGTTFAKQLFPAVGAAGAIAYRVGFSALILGALFRPWRARMDRASLVATMRYGAVLGIMNLSFYMALRTIPFGPAIAIEFLGPLCVALAASRRLVDWSFALLAALGLALLLPWRHSAGALDPAGVGFALCAGLCWALYIVFGKRTAHLPGTQVVAIGMATAALIVVPIGIHEAGPVLLTPGLIVIGIGAAILSSAVPYSLEIIALKHVPATRYGVLMSMEPAVGAVAGAMFLHERLILTQWLAVGVIVLASMGSILAGSRQSAG